jgi:putative membrane protein
MSRLEQLALSWIANAIVLAVVALILADVQVDTAWDLIVAAALFGILNTVVKPIIKLLTLPFAILTLGLVWFFVAGLMLLITDWLVDGFEIEGFGTLVLATILVWVVNLVLDYLPGPWRGTRRD